MCKHINLSFESSSTKVFMEILMFTIQKTASVSSKVVVILPRPFVIGYLQHIKKIWLSKDFSCLSQNLQIFSFSYYHFLQKNEDDMMTSGCTVIKFNDNVLPLQQMRFHLAIFPVKWLHHPQLNNFFGFLSQ